jgi:hypothetical protein
VRATAPRELLIPLMIACYAGLAGQTIVNLNRNQFLDHLLTGKAVQYTRLACFEVQSQMNQWMRGAVSIPGARPGSTFSGEGIAGSLE